MCCKQPQVLISPKKNKYKVVSKQNKTNKRNKAKQKEKKKITSINGHLQISVTHPPIYLHL